MLCKGAFSAKERALQRSALQRRVLCEEACSAKERACKGACSAKEGALQRRVLCKEACSAKESALQGRVLCKGECSAKESALSSPRPGHTNHKDTSSPNVEASIPSAPHPCPASEPRPRRVCESKDTSSPNVTERAHPPGVGATPAGRVIRIIRIIRVIRIIRLGTAPPCRATCPASEPCRACAKVGILPRKKFQSSPESSLGGRTVARFYLTGENMYAVHSFCIRL